MKPYRKTKNKKRNKSKKIKGGLFTKLRELSEGASQVASVVGLKTAPKHVYGKKVGTPYTMGSSNPYGQYMPSFQGMPQGMPSFQGMPQSMTPQMPTQPPPQAPTQNIISKSQANQLLTAGKSIITETKGQNVLNAGKGLLTSGKGLLNKGQSLLNTGSKLLTSKNSNPVTTNVPNKTRNNNKS